MLRGRWDNRETSVVSQDDEEKLCENGSLQFDKSFGIVKLMIHCDCFETMVLIVGNN